MRWFGIALGIVLLASCATTKENGLEKRVQLLEHKMSNRTAMQLLQQVDQMQREMRSMRGQLEEAQHLIQRIQESQRKQYLDLDTRLRVLEGGNPATGPNYSNSPAAPVMPPPVSENTPSLAPSSQPLQQADAVKSVPEDEAQAYRKAYETLQAGHYDAAVDAFSEFLQRYPKGEYADNAYYWLGEAYYVKRDFSAARQAFQQVVEKFQDSTKVPDVMLKMAYIDLELGRVKQAKQALQQVAERFPGTRAATLAQQRLSQLR